jgi:hypothetical protein
MKEARLRIVAVPGGGYRVSLHDTGFPAADARPVAEGNLADADLAGPSPTAAEIRTAITAPAPAFSLKVIGERLFGWLNVGGVATGWLALAGAGPLRTYLDVCDELADLPWEALAAPHPRVADFLASRPGLFVVRAHAPGPIPPIDQDPLTRMLVVVGEDAFDGMDPALLADQEAVNIANAFHWAQRCIHIEVLPQPANRDAVTDTLRKVRPHILHVLAHGGTTPGTTQPALVFRKPGNWSWSYDDIYNNIRAAGHVPRLVFLNSCRPGQAAGVVATSVAQAVQTAGVPAVVAMQAAVSVSRALTLATAFYRQLAGDKTIDEAMWAARSAVMNAGAGVGATDWVLPMLSVSRPPEDVIAVGRQAQVVTACAIRQEMYEKGGMFVDRAAERRDILGSVKPFVPQDRVHPGLVVSEDPRVGGPLGKSWLVKRAMADLLHRGLQVRYCELVGGDRPINYREVLERLRRGRPEVDSFALAALPDAAFARYDALQANLTAAVQAKGEGALTAGEIDNLFAAFLDGLRTAAGDGLLVLVFDRLAGLPPDDFKNRLLPKLLVPVLEGLVPNVRFVLVMTNAEMKTYGLQQATGDLTLPSLRLISVGGFREVDASRLFVEFCRFTWSANQAKLYDVWRDVVGLAGKGVWSPGLLRDWAAPVRSTLPPGGD